MLRTPDPVGAMRLINNLNLATTVFPVEDGGTWGAKDGYVKGEEVLGKAHEFLCECKVRKPFWCEGGRGEEGEEGGVVGGWDTYDQRVLVEDDDTRRLLWYAAYLMPMGRIFKSKGGTRRQGGTRRVTLAEETMVNALKRPKRDAKDVRVIQETADLFNRVLEEGGDISSQAILFGDVGVECEENGVPVGGTVEGIMQGARKGEEEEDPLWSHAMEVSGKVIV